MEFNSNEYVKIGKEKADEARIERSLSGSCDSRIELCFISHIPMY